MPNVYRVTASNGGWPAFAFGHEWGTGVGGKSIKTKKVGLDLAPTFRERDGSALSIDRRRLPLQRPTAAQVRVASVAEAAAWLWLQHAVAIPRWGAPHAGCLQERMAQRLDGRGKAGKARTFSFLGSTKIQRGRDG